MSPAGRPRDLTGDRTRFLKFLHQTGKCLFTEDRRQLQEAWLRHREEQLRKEAEGEPEHTRVVVEVTAWGFWRTTCQRYARVAWPPLPSWLKGVFQQPKGKDPGGRETARQRLLDAAEILEQFPPTWSPAGENPLREPGLLAADLRAWAAVLDQLPPGFVEGDLDRLGWLADPAAALLLPEVIWETVHPSGEVINRTGFTRKHILRTRRKQLAGKWLAMTDRSAREDCRKAEQGRLHKASERLRKALREGKERALREVLEALDPTVAEALGRLLRE